MRIACLVTAFPTVSETFILDQITGLIDLGCEVEIFAVLPETPSAAHPEVDAYGLRDLVHLPRVPAIWPHRARLFFERLECRRRPPFDVIHCHFGPNELRGLGLRNAGALQGKLVTSFYGYDISEFPRQRRRNPPYTRLFAQGELVLAISQEMQSKLIELGCDPKRIQVQPLGVKPRMFPPAIPAAANRPIRILSIGRMVAKKGMEYGLMAVAALFREEPHLEYVIIGDGPLRTEIERLIDDLGLGNIVRLAGWKTRPEIVKALGDADVLLAPSVTAESGDREGTPVVIMEALASGVPVVSTLHAGIPEVVEQGVSGFLVPERDVPGLAGALGRLVRNPELRARMGARGRSAMAERHDIGALNNRLLGIYRQLA
jgi:colanic acid/amylovoran biosynthesis glycosyltransferase